MERFKQIDWNPALDDMLEDVFIRDERMEKESAMYKLMRDDFTDPFKDMEDDYAEVNIELIQKYLAEDPLSDMEEEEEEEDKGEQKTKNDTNKQTKKTKKDTNEQTQEKKAYVPGLRKSVYRFPKMSCLSKAQQAICLRALLKINSNEKKGLSKQEALELQSYMALKEAISKEQKQFLEFAKSKWVDNSNWIIKSKRYVLSKWRAKMKNVCKRLPRYYIESITIPLSVQKIDSVLIKNVELKFVSYLYQGSFSELIWPKPNGPIHLNGISAVLLNKYRYVPPDKTTEHFRLPVSEDTYCENFAIENEADLVISSSGLKCLLNIDPNYLNSWIVPVVIKSHNGKNVVYIDKRIPPTISTIPQKNTWVYKYILRHNFADRESMKKMQDTEENKAVPAVYSDLDNIEMECSAEFNDHLKIYEEDFCLDAQKSANLDNPTNDNETNYTQNNVMYKLFAIGPAESLDRDQMKQNVKKYQILVRTKTDGIEMLPDGKSQYILLAPKLEHQLEFGAEAVTLEEGLHQWTSLIFRPETLLTRVRIAADNSEMIQIEKHTAASLSYEIRRLHNVKVEESLSILHNLIEGLSSLTPGRYIMRRIPQRGPFAYVYKEAEEPAKNIFDLHTICECATFESTAKTPWIPIDDVLTTPMLRMFKKMPAMFNAFFAKTGRPRGRPKKVVALRRSLRLKEASTK